MSLFVVDHEKCLQDGVCVDACPRFLVEMKSDGSFPMPMEGADIYCSNCGHCVAVCPVGALSLRMMPPEHCSDVHPDLLPSSTQVEHLLKTRRSIRSFAKRPVPRDVLGRLLDIARYAPSGSNRQPVEWIVVYNTEEVRKLGGMVLDWVRQQPLSRDYERSVAVAAEKGLDLVCRNSPHLVVAHAPKGRETDGVIALTYLELAAHSMGLGACWAGFVNRAFNGSLALKEALGIPDGRVSCGVILLGYPAHRYYRVPVRDAVRVVWR